MSAPSPPLVWLRTVTTYLGIDPDELEGSGHLGRSQSGGRAGLQPLVAESVAGGTLHASVRPADALENAVVSLLCVGTPSTNSGEANLAYIYRVVEDLIQPLCDSPPAQGCHTIVIRSPVPPGTVEDVTAVVQTSFAEAGLDVTVAVCPGNSAREGTRSRGFFVSALHGDRSVRSADHRHRVTTVRLPRRAATHRPPPHGRGSEVPRATRSMPRRSRSPTKSDGY